MTNVPVYHRVQEHVAHDDTELAKDVSISTPIQRVECNHFGSAEEHEYEMENNGHKGRQKQG